MYFLCKFYYNMTFLLFMLSPTRASSKLSLKGFPHQWRKEEVYHLRSSVTETFHVSQS